MYSPATTVLDISIPAQFDINRVSAFMSSSITSVQNSAGVDTVRFRFDSVKWISAEGVVTLSSTIRYLQHLGYKTTFYVPKFISKPSDAVRFCNDCSFFEKHFNRYIHYPSRLRETTFPLEFLSAKSFNKQYIDQLLAWLRSRIGNDYSFGVLDTSLSELFNNIIDHSGSDVGGVVFAQHYPTKGHIEVSISDAGVGIAKRIRSVFNQCKTDGDAILHAVKPSVSTKPTPRNRGAGLDTIRTIMEQHKGLFRIVANNALVRWDFSVNNHAVVESKPFAYHGTLITLRFPTQALDKEDLSEEELSWW